MDEKTATHLTLDKAGVGIVVRDLTNRRLIESASVHLELTPVLIEEDEIDGYNLFDLELVIAEEKPAKRIMERIAALHREGDSHRPVVLMTIPANFNINDDSIKRNFDGVLPMPQAPAALTAQLSVALYSHRAFSRRYEDAMEELHLNRRIFRSVTSGISVTNASQPDLPLSYVNPSFEAMTGYSLEEVLGRNCRFLQGEDHSQPGLTLIREAIKEGRSTVAVLKNYRKDGTPFWNELALSPIRTRDGKLTHFVGMQTDVTARVELETAVRESEKLAVVGRLAASIAHEINNPLESLMNLVYIAEHAEPGKEKQYLAMMDQELRRIQLITAQSLRFSRQSHKPEAVHCTELLDSVLDVQKARIKGAGVSVERRDGFHDSIVCLESEIRQVLNNLVSNATDAAKGSSGRICLRTRLATEWKTGQTGVAITIADNGAGIPKKVLSKLYQAFVSTKGDQGTGLGLWISSGIVARHHGRLVVRTRTEVQTRGTVFQLFLPYQGVADSGAPDANSGPDAQGVDEGEDAGEFRVA